MIRVLIVEPDSKLLESYRAYFDRVGWDTATATNGDEANETFLQRPADAIVLEPDLPPDGGGLLLGTIAGRTQQRPLPVVVVSRRPAISLSFPIQDYHVKPVLMSTVVKSLKNAIQIRLGPLDAGS